jgi:hypothetical protein
MALGINRTFDAKKKQSSRSKECLMQRVPRERLSTYVPGIDNDPKTGKLLLVKLEAQ